MRAIVIENEILVIGGWDDSSYAEKCKIGGDKVTCTELEPPNSRNGCPLSLKFERERA